MARKYEQLKTTHLEPILSPVPRTSTATSEWTELLEAKTKVIICSTGNQTAYVDRCECGSLGVALPDIRAKGGKLDVRGDAHCLVCKAKMPIKLMKRVK